MVNLVSQERENRIGNRKNYFEGSEDSKNPKDVEDTVFTFFEKCFNDYEEEIWSPDDEDIPCFQHVLRTHG